MTFGMSRAIVSSSTSELADFDHLDYDLLDGRGFISSALYFANDGSHIAEQPRSHFAISYINKLAILEHLLRELVDLCVD